MVLDKFCIKFGLNENFAGGYHFVRQVKAKFMKNLQKLRAESCGLESVGAEEHESLGCVDLGRGAEG